MLFVEMCVLFIIIQNDNLVFLLNNINLCFKVVFGVNPELFHNVRVSLQFQALHIDKDPISIYYTARALMEIQGIFGIIPNIYGKGDAAKRVFELMVGMRRELAGNEPQVFIFTFFHGLWEIISGIAKKF